MVPWNRGSTRVNMSSHNRDTSRHIKEISRDTSRHIKEISREIKEIRREIKERREIRDTRWRNRPMAMRRRISIEMFVL